MSGDQRPNPDELLARVEADEAKARRGKLKIFFGAAPGVGKTYAMLEAARRGLSDDRLALKDREEKVMIREQEVARREAWLKTREEEFAAKVQAATTAAATAKSKPSFTEAPFLAAKNLLSIRKAS